MDDDAIEAVRSALAMWDERLVTRRELQSKLAHACKVKAPGNTLIVSSGAGMPPPTIQNPPPPPLPRCGHPTCANEADPRWIAYCTTCKVARLTCDGHTALTEADTALGPDHPHPWNPLIPICRVCLQSSTISEDSPQVGPVTGR